MAWYAELVRRNWYCICQFNAISWYKQKLYQEWYDSLTEEQKVKLEKYREQQKQKNKEEAREALMHLMMLPAFISNIYRRY